MKKFLKKKGTKIGFIVAAAVVLLLLVVMCVRPVSVGFTYSGKVNTMGTETSVYYKINSFNKFKAIQKSGSSSVESTKWYFTNDGYFVPTGNVDTTTKEEFKNLKKEALDGWNADIMKEYGTKVNAFRMTQGDETLTCVGAIVTVVILGVIELALIGFVVASFVVSKKK